MDLDLNLTLYTKINSKWFLKLNVSLNLMFGKEKHRRKSLGPRVDKKLLHLILKVLFMQIKVHKSNLMKITKFAP